MRKLYLFLSLMCMAVLANATVYYVKPNVESTAWSDKNPGLVYTDIKMAYEAAAPGDQVWIAAGIYMIKNEELDAQVRIYQNRFHQ